MLDEFFLLDNEKNRSNIITVIKLDKIKNYEEFRSFVIARSTQHPRTRHRLVKYMGWFFFEELPFDEVEQALQKHYIRNDTIKSERDICDFVAKEQAIRDPLDSLQYKFIFVPDYSESESLMIFKSHHVLCDGIATLVLTACLQDEGYKQSQFPRLSPKLTLAQ